MNETEFAALQNFRFGLEVVVCCTAAPIGRTNDRFGLNAVIRCVAALTDPLNGRFGLEAVILCVAALADRLNVCSADFADTRSFRANAEVGLVAIDGREAYRMAPSLSIKLNRETGPDPREKQHSDNVDIPLGGRRALNRYNRISAATCHEDLGLAVFERFDLPEWRIRRKVHYACGFPNAWNKWHRQALRRGAVADCVAGVFQRSPVLQAGIRDMIDAFCQNPARDDAAWLRLFNYDFIGSASTVSLDRTVAISNQDACA